MIRLFLDQALPLRAEGLLIARGLVAVHASTAGMAFAADDEILRWCAEHDHVVVTHDHGFHQQIALANATRPSVIRIRLQGLNYEAVASLVLEVVDSHEAILDAGALISVSGKRVRVRRLPLMPRT